MRFLFAAHPAVGHTNGLRAIGRRLLSRGHRVAFATTVTNPPRWLPVPGIVRTAAEIPGQLARCGSTACACTSRSGASLDGVDGTAAWVEVLEGLG